MLFHRRHEKPARHFRSIRFHVEDHARPTVVPIEEIARQVMFVNQIDRQAEEPTPRARFMSWRRLFGQRRCLAIGWR